MLAAFKELGAWNNICATVEAIMDDDNSYQADFIGRNEKLPTVLRNAFSLALDADMRQVVVSASDVESLKTGRCVPSRDIRARLVKAIAKEPRVYRKTPMGSERGVS